MNDNYVYGTKYRDFSIEANKPKLVEKANEFGQLQSFLKTGDLEKPIVWRPMPGSQQSFLSCPAFEVLYSSGRGVGKTDTLLMDFLQDVGKGWGVEWQGILFRRTYKELQDVIRKSLKWFPRIFPDADYNKTEKVWTFATGEQLTLSYMDNEDDYDTYHGHAYPWIAWEELCSWSTDICYKKMISCSRSTVANMPRKIRATTNPYGKGHNWIKNRFRLPEMAYIPRKFKEGYRVAILGHLEENKILMHADPTYVDKIRAAARNPSEEKAWVHGSWDVTSGGMFDDLWDSEKHITPNLIKHIPKGWKIDRTFDWGSSRPFSVGWWAESNGEPLELEGRKFGEIKGDTFRIAEWYGCSDMPNEGIGLSATEIAQGIKQREATWGLVGRVFPGAADTSIYDVENSNCIASDMEKEGVLWTKADKRPGSRKQGWLQIRKYLEGALSKSNLPRETPGLFICRQCSGFIRTFPPLSRSSKDPDDVDTDLEDHIADETRYRIRKKNIYIESRSF